jgi:hypothetical protein
MNETRLATAAFLAAVLIPSPGTAQTLFAVEAEAGHLYRVNPATAALTWVGNTTVSALAGLELGRNGKLYAISGSPHPALYSIDPATAIAVQIGLLGVGFMFEGALAIAPNGIAYATNLNTSSAAGLFRIDLATGQSTLLGTISGGARDINGLAWRRDGKLVAIDRVSNALITIDPVTFATTTLATVPSTVGAVGGMTAIGDTGFYSTSGPVSSIPGSNLLYSFDLFTGASTLVGSFAPTITGMGISGLAACGGCYGNYGSGLKGAGGLVPDLLGRGCPSTGLSFQVVAQSALGGTIGAVALGATSTSLAFFGGTVLATPSIVLNVTTTGSGAGSGVASVQLTVPNVPSIVGSCTSRRSSWTARPRRVSR